ncbi:MAG: SsrA-binding protein SmpB [Elusimicrobia bacterium]|nr:MAG: SsrA-binding protein SmpB [Elusimicrobiota bacterium]
MTTVARNRRAHHKYAILETFDGGLALMGPEVKSVRAGELHLEDGFGRVENGEIFLWNVHINPYRQGSLHVAQEPTRKRKILLHKTEIRRVLGKLTTKGLTLVPLEIYFSKTGFAKVKLGLAKGKNAPDQREDLKRKDLGREMRRQFSGKHRL